MQELKSERVQSYSHCDVLNQIRYRIPAMFYWKLFISPSPFTSLTTTGVHAPADYLRKHPEWWLYSNASPMLDYQRTIVGVYLHSAMGWHNQECALMPQVEPILTFFFSVSCSTLNKGGYYPVGGTSCSTPIVAGTVALLNDM